MKLSNFVRTPSNPYLTPMRSESHPAPAGAAAGVHDRRRPDAGDRHRRQRRDLQRRRRRAAEAAAVSACRTSSSCSITRAPGIGLQAAPASAPFLYFTYREDGRRVSGRRRCGPATPRASPASAEPEEVRVASLVTDGLLPMLGATPALGRLISKHDDSPGSADTMMLSAGYWHTRFGSDPSVIGRRDHGQRQAARDHRRAAGCVPVPRPEAVADPAAAARSRQGAPRAIQLQRDRAAQAGRHARRRRPPTSRA